MVIHPPNITLDTKSNENGISISQCGFDTLLSAGSSYILTNVKNVKTIVLGRLDVTKIIYSSIYYTIIFKNIEHRFNCRTIITISSKTLFLMIRFLFQ